VVLILEPVPDVLVEIPVPDLPPTLVLDVAPDAVVLPPKLSDLELLQASSRTNPTADHVHELNLVMATALDGKEM
jgi:hypothetical protein